MFVRVLSTLLVLMCCCVVSCSNKAKYQFSRKYSPIYNPGGESFESNHEFSRAYSIYKERRDALTVDNTDNNHNKLKQKANKAGKPVNNYDAVSEDISLHNQDSNLMVDNNGINLADVVGAKFIRPMMDNDEDGDVIKRDDTRNSESDKASKNDVKHIDDKNISKELHDKENLLNNSDSVAEGKSDIVEKNQIDYEDQSGLSSAGKPVELDANKVQIKDEKNKPLPKDKSAKLDVGKLPVNNETQSKLLPENKPAELDANKVQIKDEKNKPLPKDKSAKLDVGKLPVSNETQNKLLPENKPAELDANKVQIKDEKNKSLPQDKSAKLDVGKLPVSNETQNKLLPENKPVELDANKVQIKDEKNKSLPQDKSAKLDIGKLPVNNEEDINPIVNNGNSQLGNNKLSSVEGKDKAKHNENSLRSLLDFSKGENNKKGLDSSQPLKDDKAKPVVGDTSQLKNSKDQQDTTHKVTHFLPALKDQYDVKVEQKGKDLNNDNITKNDNNENQQKPVDESNDNNAKEEYNEDYSITYYYE
ncbi:hypothetical protein EDL79_02680 [Ehrlichia ruminantium]|uniref:Lipoprotein n=1 Tax=Ehrlichia ruminantium TaxID=779 RepID=A0AAE6UKR4_EHRRU|nr:TRP75-related protein [Ehrlichia ruminantium]QGR02542.1 hypothetical protein EDL81_02670 [Ehrlichia ruminantium]QGR03463.1 hypothetical protein EDL80_02670 [Ehrlichia ruminantium]QGR04388.1 hypothetical protein EDL79_02680 [Ehrlichia ruminantium]